MKALGRTLFIVLTIATCVGATYWSVCLAQTAEDTATMAYPVGNENPTPLWPDNVATMPEPEFTALLATLQPVVPKVIAGQPYSIKPGDKPGTYDVKWGNESMVWTPQPWMEANYARLGPYYYLQWTRKNMPFRWDVPIEERDKIPARELPARTLAFVYYMAGAKNGWDQWEQKIYSPDGSLRTETKILEFYATPLFGKGMDYYTPAEAADATRLYMWEAMSPEELRGQGGVTIEYKDPKRVPEDLLYLPTVRRTRRLAGAVAQQYFPGGLFRYEDVTFNTALPQLDYKVIGFKLFDPPADLRGYRPTDYPEVKRIGDAGDVVAILQVTPKPGVSWWYAKRITYCGLMAMVESQDQEFDANGVKIRQADDMPKTGSVLHMGGPEGPPAPDWWTSWGAQSISEYSTGFAQDAWEATGGYDADTSASMFSENTLARQPMSLSEWLH
jgi:hypothetical protein